MSRQNTAAVTTAVVVVVIILAVAPNAVLGNQPSDYPIQYVFGCAKGSNTCDAGIGTCKSQSLTESTPCFGSATGQGSQTYVSCVDTPQPCFRARYFSDAGCTQVLQEVYAVCGVCQTSYSQSQFNAIYTCGNPSGLTGVMSVSQGCSPDSAACSKCNSTVTIPAFGQCVFDGTGYIAVDSVYPCMTAIVTTSLNQCQGTLQSATATYVQGACYFDRMNSYVVSTTCNGYQPPQPSTWVTPFTTAAPPKTTAAPPTVTAKPTSSTPAARTDAPAQGGTTTPPPGTPPVGPAPLTTVAPAATTATYVSRLSCTDTRYCSQPTCTAVLNGTGPGGVTIAGECVPDGTGIFTRFNCQAAPTQCVTVVHYLDEACSVVDVEDTLVCGQCFATETAGVWFMVSCTASSGSGLQVATCTDASCTQCSAGHDRSIPVGKCIVDFSNTMSVGFAVERGPFACNAVDAFQFRNDPTCTQRSNLMQAVMLPAGYCRFGNVLSCPSQPPAPTDAPVPPSSLATVPPGSVAVLQTSQCSDVHCSLDCAAPTNVDVNSCDAVFYERQLPAANPVADSYSQSFECLPVTGTAWVLTAFTNSTCIVIADEITTACGACQRSFLTGDYFRLTCGAALMIDQQCDENCVACATTRALPVGVCSMDALGTYLIAQRRTAPAQLVRHTVFAGYKCQRPALVNYTTVSGECGSGRRITCGAVTTPAALPVAPAVFAATFDFPPTPKALVSALYLFFTATAAPPQPTVQVAFTTSVSADTCGLDQCFAVSFRLTGSIGDTQAAVLMQELYNLKTTAPGSLLRWFNITSIAAAAPPAAPLRGNTTEIVAIAAVCGAVGALLLCGAILFARSRSRRTLNKDDLAAVEGDAYVAMSETSSVSSVTH